MAVAGINKPSDFFIPTQTKTVKEAQSDMGKDQFLQLLVTQLQNQDPTSPQENTEFISQMAQFSALEAMNNMSDAFTQNQTFGMVGKGIVGVVVDAQGVSTQVVGVADSAGVENGKPFVIVGDQKILASNISQVFNPTAVLGDTQALQTSAALVGKYVTGSYSADGAATPIEGRVESTILVDGKYYVIVEGKKVPINTITAVADTQDGLASASTIAAESATEETETGTTESDQTVTE